MKRIFNFSLDEFYHIYNRGINKTLIYLCKADKERFIKLLYLCNSSRPIVFKTIQGESLDSFDRGETLVDIGAYCLMPNHFHLLLKEKKDGGISVFLKKLLTAYSMYFNKKYGRTGSLFERPFKATHADTDEYLKYLFAYIHLNPVKIIDPKWKESGIADYQAVQKYITEYKYSSYLDYTSKERMEGAIINKTAFPEYFVDTKDFEQFIDEWLASRDTDGVLK